jgi:5,10-methylene-tetrahydrofolate dehydrogenase/methenyl tetrahydrofolate cyclohydrolase
VISAAGVANLVRGSWLKEGAVVIDVGTNPIEVKMVVVIILLLYNSYLLFLHSY